MPPKTVEDHRHDEQLRLLERIHTQLMRAEIRERVNAKLAPLRAYVANIPTRISR